MMAGDAEKQIDKAIQREIPSLMKAGKRFRTLQPLLAPV
jgi:hypothetical protein